MNARDLLRMMIRTDRGDMTVWSPAEVRSALDTYHAEVLKGAADLFDSYGRALLDGGIMTAAEAAERLRKYAERTAGGEITRPVAEAGQGGVPPLPRDLVALGHYGSDSERRLYREILARDAMIRRLRAELTDKAGQATAGAEITQPAAEIEFAVYGTITLSDWRYLELAPDYYGNTYMQIGGWLPEGWDPEQTPAGTQQMLRAHLHGHAVPNDLPVQVSTKGYGGPRRFMKIQWRKGGGADA